MDNLEPIISIPEILYNKGVRHAIISPGSRSAPLTLSFARYEKIKTKVIVDERSAGYIALGIAQQTKKPVVLICTSGTAILNYAPAIAEAYYQKIPLLVLTSDRPPELIDQFENQTIRQKNIYSNYCVKSFETPTSFDHIDTINHLERIFSEAYNIAVYPQKGPVHINIPLREPIYPKDPNKIFDYSKKHKLIEFEIPELVPSKKTLVELKEKWSKYNKKLILVGQHYNDNVNNSLKKLEKDPSCVVISDITANIYPNKDEQIFSDILLSTKNEELKKSLQPDLLVTYGDTIVSKSTKMFLKTYNPKEHWHIQADNFFGDPFQTLTKVITADPEKVFNSLSSIKNNFDYKKSWLDSNEKVKTKLINFMEKVPYSDFKVIFELLKSIPANSILHLGNSTPIRYASYLSRFFSKKNIKVFSNRGTSGIDGTVSTAVGSALASEKINTLIVGDLSFFYDRNALWNNEDLKNLRIIVMNNHGGSIFRMLESSGSLPELKEYFETTNNISIKNTVKDSNLTYSQIKDEYELEQKLPSFFKKSTKGKILEIELNSVSSIEVFKAFKKQIF